MSRNVVCISHLDPDLQEWAKNEAARRTEATGQKVAFAHLIELALREFRERCENNGGTPPEHII